VQNRPVLSLALTAWPRAGGDRRNSACFDCQGPDSPQTIWKIPLDDPHLDRGYFASGSIVAADGCLRVVHRGGLRSVSPDGRVPWKRSLRFRDVSLSGYSLPLAVNDGSVWFTCNGRLVRERGGFERASRWHQGTVTLPRIPHKPVKRWFYEN
jgi:hypothetical protein